MFPHSSLGHHPLLEISLSVNVGRLYVANVVRVTGMEQQDVRGYDFIALQADKITNTKLGPPLFNK